MRTPEDPQRSQAAGYGFIGGQRKNITVLPEESVTGRAIQRNVTGGWRSGAAQDMGHRPDLRRGFLLIFAVGCGDGHGHVESADEVVAGVAYAQAQTVLSGVERKGLLKADAALDDSLVAFGIEVDV
jgi:hypothetical protein